METADNISRSWMNLDEIADEGEISMKVVRRLVHTGQLPAIRIGRRYRVRRTDFERLMREGTA